MTRFAPQWLDEPAAYSSAMDRRLIRSMFPQPGIRGMVPAVVEGTMQIAIGAGACVILTGDGAVHCATDGLGETVTLGTAPPGGQIRWDIVVAEFRPTEGDWVFSVLQGTPGGGEPTPAANQVLVCFQMVTGGQAFLDPGGLFWQNDARRPALYGAEAPAAGAFITLSGGSGLGNVFNPQPGAATWSTRMLYNGGFLQIVDAGLYLLTYQVSLVHDGLPNSDPSAYWSLAMMHNGADMGGPQQNFASIRPSINWARAFHAQPNDSLQPGHYGYAMTVPLAVQGTLTVNRLGPIT